MEHIKTDIYFKDKKDFWIVRYISYIEEWNGYDRDQLKVEVYFNDKLIHTYYSIPGQAISKAKNPTKTQAQEIVKIVKKDYKQQFDREEKLKEIL